MQFLSARTMLYIRVCFLATITYYAVRDPSVIFNSGFVFLLGQAMELPTIQIEDFNDPIFGLIALAFGSLTLSEVVPLFSDNIEYFESIVPARLFVYFVVGFISYGGYSETLNNNVIFVYAFFEVWFNFLIFTNLRDERYKRVKKLLEDAQKKGDVNLEGLNQSQIDVVMSELLQRSKE